MLNEILEEVLNSSWSNLQAHSRTNPETPTLDQVCGMLDTRTMRKITTTVARR